MPKSPRRVQPRSTSRDFKRPSIQAFERSRSQAPELSNPRALKSSSAQFLERSIPRAPSSPRAFKLSSLQALEPSSFRFFKPSSLQALEPSSSRAFKLWSDRPLGGITDCRVAQPATPCCSRGFARSGPLGGLVGAAAASREARNASRVVRASANTDLRPRPGSPHERRANRYLASFASESSRFDPPLPFAAE